ncbi:hypothetical protein [Bartonella machadoae]|uniref:hypothetical protein n=1 Tax=Bartonella machadoae TaxID=2893471 RepID=UPI001F4D13C4|nr:hypothetical protein [Bartonella machadoae]UNE54974.1 hypothetical protein LNM86_03785 [Bartonella machadoae]UNE55364.1 hypothetical protein LNM86_06055 [Bartonella machadoae]
MGSKRPEETKTNQVQTTAPPSWMENVFKRGGADAYNLYNLGAGGNTYMGPRVAPLSAQTNQAIGGLGSMPHHYQNRSLMNTIYNPTSAASNLGFVASGGLMGQDPYFGEVLKEGLSEIRNSINRQFLGSGLYGSSAHKNELNKGLNDALARIVYDRRDRDLQHMMQANAMIDQANQNQLGASSNFLQGYGNAYSNALQGGGVLDDYNQRLVDANRERWMEQDNRGWSRLNMLMNAGHGFARNYGTTTNNSTVSKFEGNNPWKNAGTVGSLALQAAPMVFGYMAGGPAGAAAAGSASFAFQNAMKNKG